MLYNRDIFHRFYFLKKLGEYKFKAKVFLVHSSKPPYKPNPDNIILDITYDCNLKCIRCNRSCRYAPTNEYMTINQIQKFIDESIEKRKKWKQIWIEGGEPTLHPQIDEIIDLLLKYKHDKNKTVTIQINSNGYSDFSKSKLKELGLKVKIFSSEKRDIDAKDFCSFNLAPVDLLKNCDIDYSVGCYLPALCGFSLNMNGYYCCSNAGGIDRVIGMDIGIKELPDSKHNWWSHQMNNFCRYCGHFIDNNKKHYKFSIPKTNYIISDTWKNIYRKYNNEKIVLNKY